MSLSLIKLENHFKNLSAANRLSHAYVFYGPDRSKPLDFSYRLAGFLSTGHFSHQTTVNPDLFLVGENNESSSLGIDLVRAIKHFLSLHPHHSPVRLALVIGAERLTREAQNAMLKISEDAPPHSLLILIANHPSRLLPTLSSRLESFYFPPSSDSIELPEFLRRRARDFLTAAPASTSNFIKELTTAADAPTSVFQFLAALLQEFNNSPRYWRQLRAILNSNSSLHEYQLNRRLELEALAFELRRLEKL
jgi:DNA polymerase III delta prime subunit